MMLLSLYVFIVIILLFGTSIVRAGFNEEYISKNQSNCVKGVFIIFVFARHIWPYIKDAGVIFTGMDDRIFHLIDGTLGQLIVAMFLFYSGYGVMESYRKKGIDYVNGIPKRRILTTLLNFDVAVCVFLLVDFILNISYPISRVLLSFTGWLSVGNSNWYIFVILLCYLSTCIGLKIAEKFKCKENIMGGGDFYLYINMLYSISSDKTRSLV